MRMFIISGKAQRRPWAMGRLTHRRFAWMVAAGMFLDLATGCGRPEGVSNGGGGETGADRDASVGVGGGGGGGRSGGGANTGGSSIASSTGGATTGGSGVTGGASGGARSAATGGAAAVGGRSASGGRTGTGGGASGGAPASGGTGTGGAASAGGASGISVPRPAASRGAGFYVVGTRILDRTGAEVQFRGINHTHFWGNQTNNMLAIPQIAKTRANIVRVVFDPASTPAARQAVVEAYAANGLPVIVEDHRGTCGSDPTLVSGAVDTWLTNATWLVAHEPHTILNITNEWGPDANAATVWGDTYVAQVPRLRAAGLHHLILIDAGGFCGQNPRSIIARGRDILNADPEHNVAFAVHAYGFWRTPEATDVGKWNDNGTQDPWAFEPELTALHAAGFAIVMGEIGFNGATEVLYQTKPALQIFARLGIGWVGWSWNQNSPDTGLDFMAVGTAYQYNSPADLSDGGKLFVLDPDVGIQSTAVPTHAF